MTLRGRGGEKEKGRDAGKGRRGEGERRKVVLRFLGLLLCTLLVVTACTTVRPERPPLRFAFSLWPGYFPTAIAQEKGFFARQGVEVKTFYGDPKQSQLSDFGARKYDGMVLALGNLVGLLEGNPTLRVVAEIAQSNGADAIVAQPQIQRVADLKGKRLGVRLGGFGELFVEQMLNKYGLATDAVQLNNVIAQAVPSFLRDRQIQAGHTWEPFVSALLKDGYRVLFTSAETPGLIPDVIAFQDSVLQQRPEDVRAFLRAWFQAVEFWQTHPEEGNEIVARVLKLEPEAVSLAGLQLLSPSANQSAFNPGNTTASLYHTAQIYIDFAIRVGNLTRPPDLAQLLDRSFLP